MEKYSEPDPIIRGHLISGFSTLKMPFVTGLQASMYIAIIRQNQNSAAMAEAKGLYLLAYGLEGALLLGFGA